MFAHRLFWHRSGIGLVLGFFLLTGPSLQGHAKEKKGVPQAQDNPLRPPRPGDKSKRRRLPTGSIITPKDLHKLKKTVPAKAKPSAPWFRYPALSPDGKHLAFSYQGDLWRVPAKGGLATRLTIHRAYDFMPRWSPDGKTLLFTSTRHGNADLYTMPSQGGSIRRITFHSASDIGNDWSSDGRWILFDSNRENVARSLFRVPAVGGTPTRVVGGYWNIAHHGRLSPDGHHILLTNTQESMVFWWRKGYKGPNNANIILYSQTPTKKPRARALTRGPHNNLWPMWAPDGKRFYFVSERSGVANLWQGSRTSAKVRPLTHFRKGPVRWPSIARHGGAIVYARNFQLWRLELRTGRSTPIPIQVRGPQRWRTPTHKTLRKVSEFSLSADGKKLAFVIHGDVFVTDAKASTSIHRVTETAWREHSVVWTADSRHLLYVSDRGQGDTLYRRDALATQPERALVHSKHGILFPRVAPKGGATVYVEGSNRLMLLPRKGKAQLLHKADLGGKPLGEAPSWSHDGHWVLFMTLDRNRGDMWAIHIKKRKPIRLTPLAAHDADGVFSADGKFLLYRSNLYGSDWFTHVGDDDLFLLPLRWSAQRFRENKLEALFKKKPAAKKGSAKRPPPPPPPPRTAPARRPPPKTKRNAPPRRRAKPVARKPKARKPKARKKAKKKAKPIRIETRDLESRIKRLTRLRGDDRWPKLSPNMRSVVFYSNTAGRTGLWIARFQAKTQKLSTPKPLAPGLIFGHTWSDFGLRWTPDSKALYVLHKGKVVRISVPKGKVQKLRLAVTQRIAPAAELFQAFREIWTTLGQYFYDPKMNGQDWKAIYRRYLPIVRQVQTQEDWRDLMNEMVGELNASHLGVRNRRKRPPYRTGSLGLDLRVVQGRLKLKRIVRHGAFYRAAPKHKAGMWLTAINGQPVNARTNIHRLLRNTIGKRVKLTLQPATPKASKAPPRRKQSKKTKASKKAGPIVVTLKPGSSWGDRWLRYKAWVRARRALVARLSNNTIGYLHIRGMGRRDLLQFIRDFETHAANKAGSIIDVRYNWGGNIHDRVLQILSRRRYATWRVRGLKRWPQPSYAAAHKPMVMLINERSLSDAEMTANGFRALRLGTLIGAPTYRWLIFTTSMRLLGGRSFRLPFWACNTTDNKDLEKVGVTPDITVFNTFDDRLHGRDPQLRKAITHLLRKQQKARTKPSSR